MANLRTATVLCTLLVLGAGCLGQARFTGVEVRNLSHTDQSMTVLVRDETKIWLNETVHLPAQTGKAHFPVSLPHGTYTVEATSGNLHEVETVKVGSSMAALTVVVNDNIIGVGWVVVD